MSLSDAKENPSKDMLALITKVVAEVVARIGVNTGEFLADTEKQHVKRGSLPNRILRKPEVLNMVGVSDATLWRWEKAGRFPKRLELGGNSKGWLESEVRGWIASRASCRK